MAHEVYTSHTFKCDAKGCKTQITRSGDIDLIHDELDSLGWNLGETIMGRVSLDICPECSKEVESFLFDAD